MTLTRVSIAAFAAFFAACLCAQAQDATPLPEPAATPEPANAADTRVLTPEEKAEKEARKACKNKICDILATKNPQGDDVACDIVKTWREEDIVKMLGGQIQWPWGKAVCQSKLEVKRAFHRLVAVCITVGAAYVDDRDRLIVGKFCLQLFGRNHLDGWIGLRLSSNRSEADDGKCDDPVFCVFRVFHDAHFRFSL